MASRHTLADRRFGFGPAPRGDPRGSPVADLLAVRPLAVGHPSNCCCPLRFQIPRSAQDTGSGRWIAPPPVPPAAPQDTPISGSPTRAFQDPFRSPGPKSPQPGGRRDRGSPGSPGSPSPRDGCSGQCMGTRHARRFLGILRRHLQVRRLIKTARPAPGEFSEALRCRRRTRTATRSRTPVDRADHSPAVSGLLSLVVVLPAGLASRLKPSSPARRVAPRVDPCPSPRPLAESSQVLVQIVWWWNPFVWLANARIRFLREQAVDEHVLLLNRGAEESRTPPPLGGRPLLRGSACADTQLRRHSRVPAPSADSPGATVVRSLPARAGLRWPGLADLVLTACLALPMACPARARIQSRRGVVQSEVPIRPRPPDDGVGVPGLVYGGGFPGRISQPTMG